MYELLLWDIEQEILSEIIKQIKRGNMESATWLTSKLKEQSIISNRTNVILKKYIPEVQKAINYDISNQIKKVYDTTIKNLNVTSVDYGSFKTILDDYSSTLINSFNLTSASLINNAPNVFIQSANKASLLVSSGTVSSDKAMSILIKEWSKKGIPAIVDKGGRTWNSYTYASNILRSTNRAITTDVQNKTFDDYDIDLVEISSHVGARPLCEPYQGKVFSRSGKSKKYPPLSSTSMGEPAGLFGINCGHTMYPYIDGTKKTYDTYPKKENDKIYKESQKQRVLENNIRKSKQELSLAKKSGLDTTKYKKSVSDNQSTMRSFIKETGRTRYYSKERLL